MVNRKRFDRYLSKILTLVIMFVILFWLHFIHAFDITDPFTMIPQAACLAAYFWFLYKSLNIIIDELSGEPKHGLIPVQAIVYILASSYFLLKIIAKFTEIVDGNRSIFGLKIQGSGDEEFYEWCYKFSFPLVLLAFIVNFCKASTTINGLEFGRFAGLPHSKLLNKKIARIWIDAILRLVTAVVFLLIEHTFSSFNEVEASNKNGEYMDFIGEIQSNGIFLYLSIFVWLVFVRFWSSKNFNQSSRWWVLTFIQMILGFCASLSLFVFGVESSGHMVALFAVFNAVCCILLIATIISLEFLNPFLDSNPATQHLDADGMQGQLRPA